MRMVVVRRGLVVLLGWAAVQVAQVQEGPYLGECRRELYPLICCVQAVCRHPRELKWDKYESCVLTFVLDPSSVTKVLEAS